MTHPCSRGTSIFLDVDERRHDAGSRAADGSRSAARHRWAAVSAVAFRTMVAVFTFMICSTVADAATVEIQSINTDDGPLTVIAIEGEFVPGDEAKFVDAASGTRTAIVVFSSPGGSAGAGIEIGKAIRLKGFATYVPDGFTCASACAAAWLAGVPRLMSERSHIGFHAMYKNTNGLPEITSSGNAVLGAYLNQLGLPVPCNRVRHPSYAGRHAMADFRGRKADWSPGHVY